MVSEDSWLTPKGETVTTVEQPQNFNLYHPYKYGTFIVCDV